MNPYRVTYEFDASSDDDARSVVNDPVMLSTRTWNTVRIERAVHTWEVIEQTEVDTPSKPDKVADLRRIIRSVEWVQPMSNSSPSCPFCGNQQHWGHAEGCEMVTLFGRKPGKVPGAES